MQTSNNRQQVMGYKLRSTQTKRVHSQCNIKLALHCWGMLAKKHNSLLKHGQNVSRGFQKA